MFFYRCNTLLQCAEQPGKLAHQNATLFTANATRTDSIAGGANCILHEATGMFVWGRVPDEVAM